MHVFIYRYTSWISNIVTSDNYYITPVSHPLRAICTFLVSHTSTGTVSSLLSLFCARHRPAFSFFLFLLRFLFRPAYTHLCGSLCRLHFNHIYIYNIYVSLLIFFVEFATNSVHNKNFAVKHAMWHKVTSNANLIHSMAYTIWVSTHTHTYTNWNGAVFGYANVSIPIPSAHFALPLTGKKNMFTSSFFFVRRSFSVLLAPFYSMVRCPLPFSNHLTILQFTHNKTWIFFCATLSPLKITYSIYFKQTMILHLYWTPSRIYKIYIKIIPLGNQ